MNFDFYIFDLDGTLLNLGNIGAYANQILVKTLNKLSIPKIPEKEERYKFWSAGDKYIEVLNKWGVSKARDFWRHYDKADFEQRKILYNQKKIALFNDVKLVLERIYNQKDEKRLGIVSNTADYVVDYVLRKFKIAHYFQYIFSMGAENDQRFAKPSPSGIISILEKCNYDPKIHNALMIGDSMSDIIAAKKAKIFACLIKRDKTRFEKGFKSWKFQPDYIIDRLDEILEL
ncbi:MAG: HAD family hydrolase [Candidatus Thorarchaeota archaeon]